MALDILGGLKSIGSGVKDFFVGTPGRTEQFQRFNPQQQGINSQLLNMLPGLLNKQAGQGMQNGFAPIAQQARTQFNTQIIPSLAERFTAMGNQRSSDFQGVLGQAAAGLEEGLAGQESKFNLAQGGQNQQLLLALLSMALQPQFENSYFPGQQGFLQSLAPGVGQGVGTLGGLSGLKYLGLL